MVFLKPLPPKKMFAYFMFCKNLSHKRISDKSASLISYTKKSQTPPATRSFLVKYHHKVHSATKWAPKVQAFLPHQAPTPKKHFFQVLCVGVFFCCEIRRRLVNIWDRCPYLYHDVLVLQNIAIIFLQKQHKFVSCFVNINI